MGSIAIACYPPELVYAASSISYKRPEYLSSAVKFVLNSQITSLRTAVATVTNAQYDKLASSYSDLCDCWQMISLLVKEAS
jgi:hypothetical protein